MICRQTKLPAYLCVTVYSPSSPICICGFVCLFVCFFCVVCLFVVVVVWLLLLLGFLWFFLKFFFFLTVCLRLSSTDKDKAIPRLATPTNRRDNASALAIHLRKPWGQEHTNFFL